MNMAHSLTAVSLKTHPSMRPHESGIPDQHIGSSIEQSVLPSDVYCFYNLRERPCESYNFTNSLNFLSFLSLLHQ